MSPDVVNLLIVGTWETLYMTIVSAALAYVIGIPFGVILYITGENGICQNRIINKCIGVIVNILRSVPFLILLVAILPFTRIVAGTTIGSTATIVPLVVAAAPYVARMVESSLKEIDPGVVEAARAMGSSTWQMIVKVFLPEAKPSLLIGAVISLATILGYSAMAGFVGGGGLGAIAINYGYYRYQSDVMLVTVALLVVIVQVFQEGGFALVRKLDKRITTTRVRAKTGIKVLVVGLLAACVAGSIIAYTSAAKSSVEPHENTASNQNETVIKVGASPTPHAEILKAAGGALAKEGYVLDIIEYNDYVLPNMALDNGELDANYFQHITYLNNFNSEKETNLKSVLDVHFEPFGLYSNKIDSLVELRDGATVAVPNDTTNEARALLLLQQEGLITLRDGAGITATALDIVTNPKNLNIKEVEAAQIPRTLSDVDLAAINGNFALNAGLSVAEDAIAVESSKGDAARAYANVLVVRQGTENTPKIKALVKALTSADVAQFITTKYNGAVVSVF